MDSLRLRSIITLLAVVTTLTAKAATFQVPDDRRLIRSAHAIVIGSVTGLLPTFDTDGAIVTEVTIRPLDVLKGTIDPASEIRLTEMGGVVGTRARLVSGSPRYSISERVLVFLDEDATGWKTHGMSLGKFTYHRQGDGTEVLQRSVGASRLIDAEGREFVEGPRNAGAFEDFVRNSVAADGDKPQVPPTSPRVIRSTAVSEPGAISSSDPLAGAGMESLAHYPPSAYTNSNFRWDVFDRAGAVTFLLTGSQPGYDSAGAAARAVAAWNNDPNSNVNLRVGSGAGGTFREDGVNSIVFNSTTDVPFGAIGYSQVMANAQHTFGGQTFWSIGETDVVMKSGLTLSVAVFEEAVTHEVGHSIGLRHSNEGTPSSSDAVMNSSVSGRYGASLGPWDREAVSHVYGSGSSGTCTPPAITTQPRSTTIAAGQSAALTVAATGTSPTYQWYRSDPSGSVPMGTNSPTLTVSPGTTSTYFVWVTNACGSVVSDAVTVTVNVSCTAPTISSNPTSRSISAGQTTTLSVAAGGTAPFTYQWYQSTPSGSVAVGGNSSSLTVAPSSTSSYFVWVYNACGSAVSSLATVTVTQGCSGPPLISGQPTSRTISAGQSTTLSVTASGAVTYQWYQSTASGSVPVGSNSPSLTAAPSASTSYFVWVYNACGGTVSSLATVTVAQACSAPPTITTQPQSTTIKSGRTATLSVAASGGVTTYQWYRSSSTGSVPIGTNSPTLSVAPTANTSYFVWVYNACGGRVSNVATVSVVR